MKILILNWRDIRNPLSGGAEIVTHEHAKAWVRAGHEVTLFTSSFPGGSKKEEINGVNIIRWGNTLCIHLLIFHLLVYLYYIRNFRSQFDLVIDQIHGVPFFTPLYVKGKKLAFIHEVAKDIWDYLYPFPISFLGKSLEKIFFKVYAQVPFITVSQSTKKDLIEMGVNKEKITVIKNGITCHPLLELKEKSDPPKVIFVNRLTRAKGIEDAIEAFRLILKELPDVQFWIVGRASERYEGKLKYLIKKHQLKSKVAFFGYVKQAKKWELIKKASVLVNPSRREGWGLIVIEANALGTPAVVYNSPGLIDSTKHLETGLICSKNTPKVLAENVLKLLSDPILYKRLRKNAWEWSNSFTWEKAGKESLELIESL